MLRVSADGVVAGDDRLLVAFSVAVGVAAEEELGRRGDQRPAAHRRDGARENQVIEEDGGLVHPPVAVGIFENRDAPRRLFFTVAFDIRHVRAHLDNPGAAVGVETHGDGVLDRRLGGDQLHMKTFWELDRFDRLLSREQWHRRRGRAFGKIARAVGHG